MKILTVIPGSPEGTSMIFAKRQVEALKASGLIVSMFFLESRTSLIKLYTESIRFRKEIKDFAPDIIHCHYGTMTSFFTVINTNNKVVITFHGSDINSTPNDGLFRDFIGRLLSQISILKANAIICVSEQIKSKLWWRKKIAKIIPMGININTFKRINKTFAREKLQWDKKQIIVLFNANNPSIKRLDIANKTIENLQKLDKSYTLKIMRGEINADDVPLYINAADCLLICSDKEGSPMIVKEAMACEIPIVGTNVGDVKTRIENIENCIVTNQNPKELAIAIEKVIKKNIRTNGRSILIKQGLTEDEITKKIIKVFENVFNNQDLSLL